LTDINNLILFTAYVCVADGLIHDSEVELIDKFLVDNNISEDIKDNVRKILGDTEDKIKLDDILKELKKSGEDSLKQALIVGLNVAFSDGFFDPSEEDIFQKFIEITNFDKQIYLNLKESIINNLDNKKDTNDGYEEKFLDNVVRNFLFTIKNFTTGKVKENIEKEYNKFLLKGKDYIEAIDNSSKIAKIDLSIAKEKIKDVDDSYKILIKEIDKIFDENKKYEKSKDEAEKQFFELLKNLQLGLKDIVLNRIEQNRRTIIRKERALDYYTISFIGKTKAGKSTLHSIVTGKGEEFIGKGQQRTTRYNRMYEWEKIRIIDTPGIGAPGGKTDEEIAKSVIDESDLICYVLKNDSIQEAEFDFLKIIKNHNKPIVILLNVKENIENEAKLELYLKNPEKWYTRKDEKSLEGHINRIKRYAEEHYKNGFFDIYPVQLLAAKMSSEENYKSNSNLLYKSSHIQDFLNSIRVQIIDEGLIKRTQTMIDGSIYILNESLQKLNEFEEPLGKLSKSLEKNKKEVLSKLDLSFKENYKILKKDITNIFLDLKENRAMDFATNNYDVKKDEVGYRWESFLKSIKFNETMKIKIESVTKDYMDEVKKALQEIEENLTLFSKVQIENMSFQMTGTFNFKSLTKILSGAVGVAGAILLFVLGASNPIGWIVSGVAILGSLLSGLFKSKEEKVREATQKLYSSIKESIEENETKTINDILKTFEEKHTEIKKTVLNIIEKLLGNIQIVITQINPEIKHLNENIQYLNKIYAYRIINYINNKKSFDIDINQLKFIEVKRDYGKELKIKSSNNFNKKDEEKITKILQEKITFLKEKEIL